MLYVEFQGTGQDVAHTIPLTTPLTAVVRNDLISVWVHNPPKLRLSEHVSIRG